MNDNVSNRTSATAALTQALLVAWWELGLFPYPSAPDDILTTAAEYLARKFRVGQRLRFVGGGLNLPAVLLDPDTEVDLQGQVGTVVATPRARVVTVRFAAYPDTPIKMYATDEEFELVDPPPASPATPPVSAD